MRDSQISDIRHSDILGEFNKGESGKRENNFKWKDKNLSHMFCPSVN